MTSLIRLGVAFLALTLAGPAVAEDELKEAAWMGRGKDADRAGEFAFVLSGLWRAGERSGS